MSDQHLTDVFGDCPDIAAAAARTVARTVALLAESGAISDAHHAIEPLVDWQLRAVRAVLNGHTSRGGT